MDTPFYGTSIDGGKEQNVKVNSTVALTCKATLMMDTAAAAPAATHQSFESDQSTLKKITWHKDGDVLNGKVSDILELVVGGVVFRLKVRCGRDAH